MTMTTREATRYRRQLIEDGFCRILNVAPAELIAQARQVADRVMEMAETGADRAELIQHTSVELWKLPALAPLMGLPAALEVLAALGYPRPRYYTGFCISKWPETGPALYWHQDGIYWDQAISYTDVPHQFFLMYYLVDTNRTNGCRRVIPGSHRKRHRLHALPPRDKEVVQRAFKRGCELTKRIVKIVGKESVFSDHLEKVRGSGTIRIFPASLTANRFQCALERVIGICDGFLHFTNSIMRMSAHELIVRPLKSFMAQVS